MLVVMVLAHSAPAQADDPDENIVPPGKDWSCFTRTDDEYEFSRCFRSFAVCKRTAQTGLAPKAPRIVCTGQPRAVVTTYFNTVGQRTQMAAFARMSHCERFQAAVSASDYRDFTACASIGATAGRPFDRDALPEGRGWYCVAYLDSASNPGTVCRRTMSECSEFAKHASATEQRVTRPCRSQKQVWAATGEHSVLIYATEKSCLDELDFRYGFSACTAVK